MTHTPRHAIDAMVERIDVTPAPGSTFDPTSGVNPDFEPARIRQRLEEAERLNRSPAGPSRGRPPLARPASDDEEPTALEAWNWAGIVAWGCVCVAAWAGVLIWVARAGK